MRVVLLLYYLPAVAYAMCFKEVDAEGRREVIRNATKVIDQFQCKIDCAEMDTCLAYFYQAKGTQCVLLGPHETEPLCAAPAKEFLKYLRDVDCPDINATKVELFGFKPNPKIPSVLIEERIFNKQYTPCDLIKYKYSVLDLHLPDGTHRTATCDNSTMTTWNKKLGTWEYKGAKNTYIRVLGIVMGMELLWDFLKYEKITNDFHEIITDQTLNISTNTPVYPCPNSYGTEIKYVREDGTPHSKNSTGDHVYCIYGSWFLLTVIDKIKTAQEIIAASCANSTM